MEAKVISRAHMAQSRADWERVRVRIMRFVLQVKLAQHWDRFGGLLLSTGERPIVELSYKDQFWGARPEGAYLVGVNALGRLLMEVREKIKFEGRGGFEQVVPTAPGVLFLGREVEPVSSR